VSLSTALAAIAELGRQVREDDVGAVAADVELLARWIGAALASGSEDDVSTLARIAAALHADRGGQ